MKRTFFEAETKDGRVYTFKADVEAICVDLIKIAFGIAIWEIWF